MANIVPTYEGFIEEYGQEIARQVSDYFGGHRVYIPRRCRLDVIERNKFLREIKGKFILSYDDVPAIRELSRGFNIQSTKPVRYSTNNLNTSKLVYKTELLISNF